MDMYNANSTVVSNISLNDSIEVRELEQSFGNISINEDSIDISESKYESKDLCVDLKSFGFSKYEVPTLLTRHPPPAVGRDDDIVKLQEILDDVLIKSGVCDNPINCPHNLNKEIILCGVDQKIGCNLLKLVKKGGRNTHYVPEFPILHLRKSKITILFSAYKDAGLLHLLQFMKDDENPDWCSLISIQHIDTATTHVKRLAVSFHVALFSKFCNSLCPEESLQLKSDIEVGF